VDKARHHPRLQLFLISGLVENIQEFRVTTHKRGRTAVPLHDAHNARANFPTAFSRTLL